MTSQNKRGRGRPIGTGKDDAPTLSKVADLIVANPALRPTTAIKRVLDRLDPSIIRRLQVKWRAGKEEYLAQARSRRAVTVAPARRASVSYSPRTARQLMAAQRAGPAPRDRQGRIVYVNPAFCRMVGFSADELLRATLPPYWPPERSVELAPKFWTSTRARLDPEELKRPLGHVTV